MSTEVRWSVGVLVGTLALLVVSCSGKDDEDGSAGRQDGHASHEHSDSDTPAVMVERDERCDVGFNTATFNETSHPAEPVVHDDDGHAVEFTVEEFAEVYVDPSHPMADEEVIGPEAFVAAVHADPLVEKAVLSGAMAHTLEPDNWLPMTDPQECEQLAGELGRARQVAERYPTATDAEAAGYSYTAPFAPGIGAHYMNGAYIGSFDVDDPAMLLYDGDGPDASIVGLSYFLASDSYPEQGFTGPNDHYHQHFGLCFGTTPDGRPSIIGPSSFTAEECQRLGGAKFPEGASGGGGYMSHVWIVPGCESDTGIFSAANPAIKYRGAQPSEDLRRSIIVSYDRTEPIPSGCGSGESLADPLDLDDGGKGPALH